MTQSTTMTIRLSRDTIKRLETLASATERTKGFLAGKAIEAYLEENEWQVQAIEEALSVADSGEAEYVSHDAVKKRVSRLAKRTGTRRRK